MPLESKLLLRQKLLDNSFVILQNLNTNLNQDLKKKLTQSIVDLVNCYFCLDKVKDPLLCPKCHNFACRSCLQKYFGNDQRKKCPMCKQEIKYTDLIENKVLREIKYILSTDKTQKTAIDEFGKVIQEKQQYYQQQKKEINEIINGFNNYKLLLENYKIGFNEYLIECQQLVNKTFESYYKTIQNLIKTLLSYDKMYQKSMDKYNEIYNKVKTNNVNSDNIKEFINEILYLEKKEISSNNKLETQKFLLSPITFKPYFQNYSIIKDSNLNKNASLLNYSFVSDTIEKSLFEIDYYQQYKKYKCILKINLKESNCDKCFFVKFCKKGQSARDFIMKKVEKEGLEYTFECNIEENNLFNPNENVLKFNVDVLEMDTNEV